MKKLKTSVKTFVEAHKPDIIVGAVTAVSIAAVIPWYVQYCKDVDRVFDEYEALKSENSDFPA